MYHLQKGIKKIHLIVLKAVLGMKIVDRPLKVQMDLLFAWELILRLK